MVEGDTGEITEVQLTSWGRTWYGADWSENACDHPYAVRGADHARSCIHVINHDTEDCVGLIEGRWYRN